MATRGLKRQFEESKEFYKYFYDHGHEMHVSVSPEDASILQVNETLCDVLGYSKEELIGQPIFMVYHPDCMEDVKEAFEKFQTEGYVKNAELILKKQNGEKIFALLNVNPVKAEDGTILYSRSSWIDVTELKKKEMELAKLRDLLRNSNEAARIGTWDIDLEKGSVNWSSMTKVIHEVPTDFIPDLSKGINFYKKGESRDNITKAVDKAMTEGASFQLDLQIVTALKNERWVRAIGLSEMKNGRCVRLYGTFQDIHDKKVAELELASILDVTSDQNKRLLNFAHIVSHNLRSHSGNLAMTLEFLKNEKDEKEKVDLMNMLEVSVNHLEETVIHLNDVVALNIKTDDNLQTVNLNYHMDGAISSVQAMLKLVGGEIENTISEQIRVKAVPAYLDSVFLNFLTNSIKYHLIGRHPKIRISAKRKNGKIALSIKDNGMGIDMEKHGSKLFGMYKTFHHHPDSKGIGLFITKNQVEAMGGTIDVKSKVDIGTTFTIYLNEEG